MQLIVPPVIPLCPLQLPIVPHQRRRPRARIRNGAPRAVPAGRDGRAGEFYADASCARGLVVGGFVEPDEVRDPVCVAVAGEQGRVGDVVGVQVVQCAVAVGGVALFVISGVERCRYEGGSRGLLTSHWSALRGLLYTALLFMLEKMSWLPTILQVAPRWCDSVSWL